MPSVTAVNQTAFIEACASGNTDIVAKFASKLDLSQPIDGKYPLFEAAMNNHCQIIIDLFNTDNDVILTVDEEDEDEHMNVFDFIDNPDVLQTVVKCFTKAGYYNILNQEIYTDGRRFLQKIRNMPIEVFRKALELGANPNYIDDEGWNILMNCIHDTEDIEYVKALLDYGVDVHHVDTEGRTAHDLAVEYGFTEIAECIQSHM